MSKEKDTSVPASGSPPITVSEGGDGTVPGAPFSAEVWLNDVSEFAERTIREWRRLKRNARRRGDEAGIASCDAHLAAMIMVRDLCAAVPRKARPAGNGADELRRGEPRVV